jgi:hypothetical protein
MKMGRITDENHPEFGKTVEKFATSFLLTRMMYSFFPFRSDFISCSMFVSP